MLTPISKLNTLAAPFVARPLKHQGEEGRTYDRRNDDDAREKRKQIFVALHIFKIINKVGITTIEDEAEEQLSDYSHQERLVLYDSFELLANGN